VQVNILGGLCAYGLTTMCCVSQAWATSEQENRRTLWRALALARWPNLGLGLQIDWRQRYRVLLQNGKPANRDKLDDPLADYAFVLQGRWGVGAAGAAGGSDELSPSFSGVVAARTYAATVSLHGNDLEFRDAFQIEIKLRTPVPLPKALSAWSNPTNASLGATNASPPPWQCPSAPARPLRLLGAHLTALGGSIIPGGRGGRAGGLGHCAPKLPIPQPLSIPLPLPIALPLPFQAWLPKSDNPFAAAAEELVTLTPTSPPPLDVTVLVQQRSTDAVAHFLTFSVRHEAVRGQLAASRLVPPGGEEDTFRVLADTTLYPTAAGCGVATVDAQGVRSRTESPWLTNMVDTFPAGLETLITGFRLEVCPLLRYMLSFLRTCVPTRTDSPVPPFTCLHICLPIH